MVSFEGLQQGLAKGDCKRRLQGRGWRMGASHIIWRLQGDQLVRQGLAARVRRGVPDVLQVRYGTC